jgi:hypothetical protein
MKPEELADELEALSKQDRFSIVDLGVCAQDNLPAILSALRDREVMRGQIREAVEGAQPLWSGEVARVIGYYFAGLVSRNPQPCMSGDPRDHIQPWERQRFDRAEAAAAEAVQQLFRSRRNG